MLITISSDDTISWNGNSAQDQLQNNVLNLLRTVKGEVRFDMQQGINPDYVDNPVSYLDAAIVNDIRDLLDSYAEYAQYVTHEIIADNDKTTIKVVIDL